MPYKIIGSQCTGCTACEVECPNNAIRGKGSVFIIKTTLCTECIGHFDDPQCVAACPVDETIVIDDSVPRYPAA